jgi:hypothetical protein
MHKTAQDVLIGDLLRGAGLVSLNDLSNAVQVASKTGLPVGRVLVMLGVLTSELVQAALHGQSMVRDKTIDRMSAMRALMLVASRNITFDDAVAEVGTTVSPDAPTNKLGDLLTCADVISHDQLADALNASQHLGLPLGRILVLKNILSETEVQSALEAQMLLRDNRLTREQALEALRNMRYSSGSLIESLRGLGFEEATKRNVIRLGELVMLADLVTESDLLTALEMGLSEGTPIGQALIEFGFINEEILDSALRLQAMVGNHHLTVSQAADALGLVSRHQFSLVQAVVDVMEPALKQDEVVSLLHLLRLAGLINEDGYNRLLMFKDTSIFEVVLAGTGVMSETTLQVAIGCHMLMREELLTCEQAIVALHHWRWTGIDLPDILLNMGWSDGRKPSTQAMILSWTPSDEPQKSPVQADVELGYNTSLAGLEISVTGSLSNFEWGSPQIHNSWH